MGDADCAVGLLGEVVCVLCVSYVEVDYFVGGLIANITRLRRGVPRRETHCRIFLSGIIFWSRELEFVGVEGCEQVATLLHGVVVWPDL